MFAYLAVSVCVSKKNEQSDGKGVDHCNQKHEIHHQSFGDGLERIQHGAIDGHKRSTFQTVFKSTDLGYLAKNWIFATSRTT